MRGSLLAVAVTAAVAALAGSAIAGSPRPWAAGGRAAPGAQLWVSRFPGGGSELFNTEVVSPGGSRVFITGADYGGRPAGDDIETVAYAAGTGRQLWAIRYNGPGNNDDQPSAIAVSPRGGTVFVTGSSGSGSYYVTVAYAAATGRQLWARRYHGPGNGLAGASAVAVSPGGGAVFVTGYSQRRGAGQVSDYATVAYAAATGRQLWARSYSGPVPGLGDALSVAVSPGGRMVFVTGRVQGREAGFRYDYATVAYAAGTGRQLWARRYDDGIASSLAVSPGGTTVFVTGTTVGAGSATVAYAAATGRQLWARRDKPNTATSLALSPDGRTVFVTGDTRGYGGYAIIAYRSATGRQLWASRYNNGYEAESVAVSPDGTTVYVTGGSATADYATVAYNAATGRQLWARRYYGQANNGGASSVAVTPNGATVLVTGWTQRTPTAYDYTTIAYRG